MRAPFCDAGLRGGFPGGTLSGRNTSTIFYLARESRLESGIANSRRVCVRSARASSCGFTGLTLDSRAGFQGSFAILSESRGARNHRASTDCYRAWAPARGLRRISASDGLVNSIAAILGKQGASIIVGGTRALDLLRGIRANHQVAFFVTGRDITRPPRERVFFLVAAGRPGRAGWPPGKNARPARGARRILGISRGLWRGSANYSNISGCRVRSGRIRSSPISIPTFAPAPFGCRGETSAPSGGAYGASPAEVIRYLMVEPSASSSRAQKYAPHHVRAVMGRRR